MENSIVIPDLADDADARDAIRWLRRVTTIIGPGFHPDTEARDYVSLPSGEPLFTETGAAAFDRKLDRVFDILEAVGRDPYAVAIKVQRRLLSMPAPA